LVGSYKKGTHLQSKRALKVINHKQVDHFKMEFEEPIPICIDGEIKGAKSVEFTVVPHGVNFVIPKGCEYKHNK
jgi:diacylglycerol kinase family enzyme